MSLIIRDCYRIIRNGESIAVWDEETITLPAGTPPIFRWKNYKNKESLQATYSLRRHLCPSCSHYVSEFGLAYI